MLPLGARAHPLDVNMAQICPLQELTLGVLEARDVKREDFYDFFPHVYTHLKGFRPKKNLASTTEILKGALLILSVPQWGVAITLS